MELNLARDIKDNKKGFCKNTSSKRKARENVDTAEWSRRPDYIRSEKTEELNTFFASVFNSKTGLQESKVLEREQGKD